MKFRASGKTEGRVLLTRLCCSCLERGYDVRNYIHLLATKRKQAWVRKANRAKNKEAEREEEPWFSAVSQAVMPIPRLLPHYVPCDLNLLKSFSMRKGLEADDQDEEN